VTRQPIGIGEILDSVLRSIGLSDPLVWKRLEAEWPEVAGEPWSTMSRPVALTRSVLLVEAVSPAAVSILRFGVAGLTQRLNQALGAGVVKDVKVRPPGRQGTR
jgi:hypothetical protein